jgi:hypothetical protein
MKIIVIFQSGLLESKKGYFGHFRISEMGELKVKYIRIGRKALQVRDFRFQAL